MVMRLMVMFLVPMIMIFFLDGVMFVIVRGAVAAVGVVMAMLEFMGMGVLMVVHMAVLLLTMLVRMFVVMLVLVGVHVLVGVRALRHTASLEFEMLGRATFYCI